MSQPNIANLANRVEDVRRAALDGDAGPTDPTDFHTLRGRLMRAQLKLPALYQTLFLSPMSIPLTSSDKIGSRQS